MKTATRPAFATVLVFLRAVVHGRGSLGFVLGTMVSFGLSISVVLCTMGLMDGFDHSLKQALKLSAGDLALYSGEGFFVVEQAMHQAFKQSGADSSPLVKTEGLLVQEDFSQGVVVKGVEGKSYSRISGLDLAQLGAGEMVIGRELAHRAGFSEGDEVILAMATGKRQLSSLPAMHPFRIKSIVEHKIYHHSLRLVYVDRTHLQALLGLGEKVNMVALNKFLAADTELIPKVLALKKQLAGQLGPLVTIRAFWQEFAPLLEAVKVEKFTMTMILQLVVIVASFNVVALVVFLNQQKARDIFLFQALGATSKNLVGAWLVLLAIIWLGSCLLAMGGLAVFDWAMLHLSFLQLPGEIYHLQRIHIRLSTASYVLAFFLSGLWPLLVSWPGLKRLSHKSLLSQLRLEFDQ